MESAQGFLADALGLSATITAVSPEGDGWLVTAEAIVEDEYMRQRARRDILGTYEVLLDSAFNVRSFVRKDLRERGTVSV